MIRYIFKIAFVISFISCYSLKKPNSSFIEKLNTFDSSSNNKLNFNGAYHVSSENEYLLWAIYFFKSGLVYYDYSNVKNVADVEIEKEWMPRHLSAQKDWGIFTIKGDTINVCSYFGYIGSRRYYLLTYFQGIIKDNETIIDWHVVAPFPKLDKTLSGDYDSFLKEHRILHFTQLAYKPIMDSISNYAWINKYRSKL